MGAKVTRDKQMQVSSEKLYEAIVGFNNYPEFIDEVVSAEVEQEDNGKAVVKFELELVKRFNYILEFEMLPQTEVRWKLKESNFFKQNEGIWRLKADGEVTQVAYELEVDFGFFVPKWISKKLTEVNLPKMFESFEARAKSL